VFEQQLKEALQLRRNDQLWRSRRTLESAQGPEVVVDGKRLLGFASNDYLGLANHPEVAAAFKSAVDSYGVGSGAALLVCGHSREHHLLEQELAEFTGRDRALLFSTGYMANMGTLMALLGQGDLVVEDKLNHASLLDGGLVSGAKFRRYLHNDLDSLERTLALPGQRKLVVTDGVFSMDGDLAPLQAIAQASRKADAWLMVDDAHGLGVLGKTGAGTLEHLALDQQHVPILMGTLGKALGSFGAFIAGSEVLIETLIQFARPYIYTTALPPAVAAASRASLALVRRGEQQRQHLQSLIAQFRSGAEQLGLNTLASNTAIQPVLMGSAEQTLAAAQALEERGIWVGAIRPPTVPQGSGRLRITLSASHSPEQVNRLLDALAEVYPRQPEVQLS